MSDYNTVCLTLYDYHQLKDDKEFWKKEAIRFESISVIPELEREIYELKYKVELLEEELKKKKKWWHL